MLKADAHHDETTRENNSILAKKLNGISQVYKVYV